MAAIAVDTRGLPSGTSLFGAQTSRTSRTSTDTKSVLDGAGESRQTTDGLDRVTLSGDTDSGQVSDSNDMAQLAALMRSLRPAGRTAPSRSGPQVQQRRPAVALQSLFSGTRSATQKTSGLLDSLQGKLADLYQSDPEQAGRLLILLRTLARLDPENMEAALKRISSAMESFGGLQQQIATAAQTPATQGQPVRAPQAQVEMVHVSLDLEVTASSEVTTALAELREGGVAVQVGHVQTSQTISVHIEYTGVRQQQQQSDPLVVDLGGDGVELTGVADGASFDINGDGRMDRTAFVRGNDAFLALDRNGNGRIDGGRELFGDQNGARNGFEELAKYDGNGDGKIDANDSIYSSLRLLHDVNGDGTVALDELSTLAQHGIESIGLNYAGARVDDGRGNALAERGQYARSDGARGGLVDVWLSYE